MITPSAIARVENYVVFIIVFIRIMCIVICKKIEFINVLNENIRIFFLN